MVDIRLWYFHVRLRWRWQDGELVFSMDWRKKEMEMGMTGLQNTVEVMEKMMNSVYDFLKLTMESDDDFDGVLLLEDNKTMYKFLGAKAPLTIASLSPSLPPSLYPQKVSKSCYIDR